MRLLIAVLLVSAISCATLSPYSKLPNSFDDMVFNNLGNQAVDVVENSDAIHKISQEVRLSLTALPQILTFVKSEIAWVSTDSLNHILSTVAKLIPGGIFSHFITAVSKEENAFIYALVHLITTEYGVKVVVSWEKKNALGIMHDDYYHDVQESVHGLPLGKLKVLISQTGEIIPFEAERQKLLESVRAARGTQKADLLAMAPLQQATFTGVLDAVKAVAQAWQAVATAFKTVNRETLIRITGGKGFTQYASSSKFLRSIGISLLSWETYKQNYIIITGMDINSQVQAEAQAMLTLAEFMPDNAWYFNTNNFGMNTGGTTMSIVAMTQADLSVMKANVLTVVTTGSYTLAPDVYIYEKFRSVAGGIYQSTKEVRKYVPRALTEADIKGINALNILNAINMMTKAFNIPFTLPAQPADLI